MALRPKAPSIPWPRHVIFRLSVLTALLIGLVILITQTNHTARVTVDSLDATSGDNTYSSVLLDEFDRDLNTSSSWLDMNDVLQVRRIIDSGTTETSFRASGLKSNVVADRIHSHTALEAAQKSLESALFMSAHGISSIGVDEQRGQVRITAAKGRVEQARVAVELLLGTTIAYVTEDSRPRTIDGLDNHRDVLPFAGAESIRLAPAKGAPPRKQCTSAFSMYQAATNKYFQVTAGHCTEAWEGAWTGTGWSSRPPFQANPIAYNAVDAAHLRFTRFVGSNANYSDSLCASQLPSHRLWTCPLGSLEYRKAAGFPGDLSILRVASAQPYIWTGLTTRKPVYFAQRLPPMNGRIALCVSGETTPNFCADWLLEKDVSVLYCDTSSCKSKPTLDSLHLIKGLTRITKLGTRCSHQGDSGGAVYQNVAGPRGQAPGVRAVGVISGIGTGSACVVYFTPIQTAVKLFGASVVTHG